MTETFHSDVHGRRYAKLSKVKPFDLLELDDGFDCMNGTVSVLADEETGELYVPCERGKHLLEGQENEDGYLIGMYPVEGK